jgi:hypothetical protein
MILVMTHDHEICTPTTAPAVLVAAGASMARTAGEPDDSCEDAVSLRRVRACRK